MRDDDKHFEFPISTRNKPIIETKANDNFNYRYDPGSIYRIGYADSRPPVTVQA